MCLRVCVCVCVYVCAGVCLYMHIPQGPHLQGRYIISYIIWPRKQESKMGKIKDVWCHQIYFLLIFRHILWHKHTYKMNIIFVPHMGKLRLREKPTWFFAFTTSLILGYPVNDRILGARGKGFWIPLTGKCIPSLCLKFLKERKLLLFSLKNEI